MKCSVSSERRGDRKRRSACSWYRPCVLVLEDRTLLSGGLDLTFHGTGKKTIPFDLGGLKTDVANGVTLQPDGKIVLAGDVDFGAGNSDFGVARLKADGTADTTFGAGGKRTIAFDLGGLKTDVANGVTLQP